MKVFDLHCDTLSELRRAEMRGDGQTFAHNNGHIDLEKLEKGDYMLQCFAAFVNLADPTPGADPLVTALEEIDVFKRMMEQYSDRVMSRLIGEYTTLKFFGDDIRMKKKYR